MPSAVHTPFGSRPVGAPSSSPLEVRVSRESLKISHCPRGARGLARVTQIPLTMNTTLSSALIVSSALNAATVVDALVIAVVGSSSRRGLVHFVRVTAGGVVCDCENAAFRPGTECRHIRAARDGSAESLLTDVGVEMRADGAL